VLFEPWTLRSRTARNHVLFGPHVTNLGDDRVFSDRHAAYYARRARGGAGVIVTETASVHESDWPYERAPLASECGPSWRLVANAAHEHGALVLASIGHTGLQGSTAYSQGVLWAPSLVANVLTHEMPYVMELSDVTTLRAGTVAAARTAVASGCDGVELNAGQFSLFRQFQSGLTNQRTDEWGDRTALLSAVLHDLRNELGDLVLGVRVVGDELAPWAGITPELATQLVGVIDAATDYVVIERGSIFSEAATRPDMQAGATINGELLATLKGAIHPGVSVVAQGSIVDVRAAQQLLDDQMCHAVEMTRAQIADPDLVAKSLGELAGGVRPCVLCNQGCQVRDVRNPLVSCSVNPTAGYELREDHFDELEAPDGRTVVVAGAGPAGMEAARCLAATGARVTIRERSSVLGGSLRAAAALPGRERWLGLVTWYEAELRRLGVEIEFNSTVVETDSVDIVATGASVADAPWRDGTDGSIQLVTVAEVLDGAVTSGSVAVLDPVGGVVGVGVAELLASRGCSVSLVSPDLVAATQLSLTGDLVAANARLANANVRCWFHSAAVAVRHGALVLEDRFSGETTQFAVDVIVDAGFALPTTEAWRSPLVGDALAPRTVYAAVLEGRRIAAELATGVPA
jgi:mycofactocin system FadH/OYE family oxidoreductase 1